MTEVRSARPAGSAALDVEALHDLLASSFEVSVGKPRVVRRTVLDTFDRRLERAGQRLQLVAEAGEERLELVQSGETLVSVLAGTGPRWPAMAGALPDGTLKDHVARLAGIRALLVVDERRRLVHRAELRNADRKIVVRLDVDEPADGGAAPPPVVTVRPLRGYQKEADRAWRLVTTLLEPATDEPVAPRAASPSVADPESPARALLAAELTDFLQEVRDNLPGTIGDVDTEFLHDVRVAVRRTRSLLKLGRPALPAHVREAWEPQFKWLGDLTTPVRDLDVYQLGLPEMAGWLVAASAADLEPFQAHLARRRAADRRTLLRALRGARLRRLLDDWAGELSALADSARSAEGAAWSAGALARANRRAGAPAGRPRWHLDLRLLPTGRPARAAEAVQGAALRAGDVRAGARRRPGRQGDQGPQEPSGRARPVPGLGGAAETLHGFAQEMVADGAPAEALLAMGELMGHLYAEQQRARAEFATAFASYVRPASHRRMARLLGSGGKAAG